MTAARRNDDGIKRALDVAVASLLLVLAAPVMAVVAGCVALTMGRPLLFRQARPGLYGELFELVKFRSAASGWTCASSPGRW